MVSILEPSEVVVSPVYQLLDFVLKGIGCRDLSSQIPASTCKLLSSHEISELRKVSERHKMSTLLLEI